MSDWTHIEPKESMNKVLKNANPKDTSSNKINNAEKFYKAIAWHTCDSEYIKEIIKCA